MATVDKIVNGQPIELFMARNKKVQAALRAHARNSASRARVLLGQHRHAGHAYITYERANWIDWQVTLHDPSGVDPEGKYPDWWSGAMSIEYGRKEGTKSPFGPMEGLFILHRAVGIGHYVRGGAKFRVPGTRKRGFIKYV